MRRWNWDQSLSLGVVEIDGDHRRFSLLLQDLDDAIAAGGRGPDLELRLRAIALDALGHFESEDRLFEKCEYPERAPHARAHEEPRQILKEQVLRESRGADESGKSIPSLRRTGKNAPCQPPAIREPAVLRIPQVALGVKYLALSGRVRLLRLRTWCRGIEHSAPCPLSTRSGHSRQSQFQIFYGLNVRV